MNAKQDVGLAAANAVMFSDEAMERAARALSVDDELNVDSMEPWVLADYQRQVRLVIAALKGAGDE